MRFLGVNANGLRSKLTTFKKVLTTLKPSVFFIEESKYQAEGKLKLENFIVFELIRQDRDGGGLALGCAKELQPVWVRQGTNRVEALTIEICVQNMNIRCCVGYGPQENDRMESKEEFWKYLDEDVYQAQMSGSGYILHFDGNLWAGDSIVPGDPRPQNKNGQLFQSFLERNPQLTVVNALPKCEGLVTRKRIKDGVTELSVLDFFVVCERVLPFIEKMVIDERKQYILTNYKNVKKGGKAVDSDHFTQFMDLDLKLINEKPKRVEIYNFKEEDAQQQFKLLTTETDEFSKCFMNELPLYLQVNKWRNTLDKFCKKSFKKIRIRKKFVKPIKECISKLIDRRNLLCSKQTDPEIEKEISKLSQEIADGEAKENREKIINNFKEISEDPDKINLQKMWKMSKKLWPKNSISIPTAKRNHMGKVVTGPRDIRNVLAKEYKDRLRSRPARPDLVRMNKRKSIIFKMKMKLAEMTPSPDWSMKDLDRALSHLKKNKSRDFEGYINEIFKLNVIGVDLKKSLLLMFNKLKKEKMIPDFMNFANVTTVPKTGSRIEPTNERGIFRTPVVRSILMRLIYDMKYSTIDSQMSDCQMGGRKGKSCRNNIFIINGLIHEALKSKTAKAMLFQICDYKQMFDSMKLQEALSDLYDVGVQDDTLALLHGANSEIQMAVKTPSGLTQRQSISDCVLQGDTWGSIMASVQVDSIGKQCLAEGYSYLYKNKLPVGFLGLVDDVIGITEVGIEAQKLNAFFNIKTAEKALQFGTKKCKSMLVGKNVKNVINSNLMFDKWELNYSENINSGEAETNEIYLGLTEIEKTNEQKYLGFILSNTDNNMAHINYLKKKSHGTIRTTLNRLNSMNLGIYYFECALILMNVMVRSSLLYACDTYYNLKETEVRQIERIEECFLRKILNTSKGCPITELYFSVGHTPARFEIQKMRLLFLQYILQQDEESLLKRFFLLQLELPTKGDWASTCLKDLKELKIDLSLEDIKKISENKFRKLIKVRSRENAFIYLKGKQGTKGKENNQKDLSMAEYLQPANNLITIEEKQRIFSMKNRMTNIPANYPKPNQEYTCYCGKKEDMIHVYNCEILNNGRKPKLEYEKLYKGTIIQQIEVFRKFETNLKIREEIKTSNFLPCDLNEIHCIPPSIVMG